MRQHKKTSRALKRLTDWCQHDALPFWAEHGLDPKGGCYESLDADGRPNTNDLRRVRVQARMAYTYAHAAYLGWYKNAKVASDHCWNYLTTNGFQGGPHGCAHLLNPDGSLHGRPSG